MTRTKDALAFLCIRYPGRQPLAKDLASKLLYLADWRSAIEHGRQLTDLQWQVGHEGPKTEDVFAAVRTNSEFSILLVADAHGSRKELLSLKKEPEKIALSREDLITLQFVLQTSTSLFWPDFVRLIYATYPMSTQPKYKTLDLVALASKYNEAKKLLQV